MPVVSSIGLEVATREGHTEHCTDEGAAWTVALVWGCLEADSLYNEGSPWAFVPPSSQGSLGTCLEQGTVIWRVLLPSGVSGRVAEILLFQLSCVRKLFCFHHLSNFGL